MKAFEKSMEISRLSYEFTRVLSPIDGQISRYYLEYAATWSTRTRPF